MRLCSIFFYFRSAFQSFTLYFLSIEHTEKELILLRACFFSIVLFMSCLLKRLLIQILFLNVLKKVQAPELQGHLSPSNFCFLLHLF